MSESFLAEESARRTLVAACRKLASTYGSRMAFRDGERAIDFASFNVLSDRVAALLSQRGIGAGDRVAMLAKDSIESYAFFFGGLKAGAILVPLNWRLSTPEITSILNDCQAAAIYVDAAFAEKIDPAFSTGTHLLHELMGVANLPSDVFLSRPLEDRDVNEPIVLIYTSGTTGKPKGVMLPNRTFFDLLEGMASHGDRWMGIEQHDVLLLSLPMFHIGGLWWAIQGFLAGACGELLDSFVGWKALERIQQARVTKVAMVPAMVQFTLSEPNIECVDLSSVTGFLYGGSPIAPALLRQAMDRFQCHFFQIYGLTETGNMAVCLRPVDHQDEQRWGSAGRPLPGVELKILDAEKRELAHGQTGEIWIKSPSVMIGYWNNTAATDEVLHDGWIRTGDAGYTDGRGFLFVCDRIKDMIIYAGENIYPAEIESMLREHESIADVAVIGIPDARCGELVKAFLVSKPNVPKPKVKDLIAFSRPRIADFKIPKSFEFVEALPRNPSGKILKHVLRKPYWENFNRKVN